MVRKNYEKLFTHLKPPEPPEGLLGRIMLRIRGDERRRARTWRFAFFTLIFLATAGAAVPAFQSLQTSLTESGSIQFASLLFSDFGAVTAYWQSFGLALLESLPAMSIAIFLAVIFGFLQSLKCIVRDIKVVLAPAQTY